jgi:hypothetical protein
MLPLSSVLQFFCHCFERMIIFSVVMSPKIRGPSLTTLQEAEIAAAQVRMARGKRPLLTESVPCSVMSWLSPHENRVFLSDLEGQDPISEDFGEPGLVHLNSQHLVSCLNDLGCSPLGTWLSVEAWGC